MNEMACDTGTRSSFSPCIINTAVSTSLTKRIGLPLRSIRSPGVQGALPPKLAFTQNDTIDY